MPTYINIEIKSGIREVLSPPNRAEQLREEINRKRFEEIRQYVINPSYIILLDWNLRTRGWDERVVHSDDLNVQNGINRGTKLIEEFLEGFSVSNSIFHYQSPKFSFEILQTGGKFRIHYDEKRDICFVNIPMKWSENLKKAINYSPDCMIHKTMDDIRREVEKEVEWILKSLINNPIRFNVPNFVVSSIIGFATVPDLCKLYYIPSHGFISGGYEESSFGCIIGGTGGTKVDVHAIQVLTTLYGRETSIIDWSDRAIELARRSAGTNILVESYAHNIGAHGLEGLKRYVSEIWGNFREGETKTESVIRIRELLKDKLTNTIPDIITSYSQLPEYISYLQGKSAFWNAVSRGGTLFGGKIENLWSLIDGFAKNNLLCGSLGASEGFDGIEFHIHYDNEEYNIGISDKEDIKIYRFEEEGFNEGEPSRQKLFQTRIGRDVDGDYFKRLNSLWEKLTKCEVFLPEGVVGQQAVYTIWENIVRNVKHCIKQDNDNNVPFHIEIEDSGEFYQITNWIDLASGDIEDAVNKMNNWKGILVNDKPNMGGTSQNILCAGMILGADFLETEKRQKESKENEKIMKFKIKKIGEKKRIAHIFKIWKGRESEDWMNIKDKKEVGPHGRFKIIKVNTGERDDFLVNSSSIRHVVTFDCDDGNFGNLYKRWVQEFVLCKDKYPKGLILWERRSLNCKYKFSQNSWKEPVSNKIEDGTPYYQFYHREPEKDNNDSIHVPYKTDGVMRNFNFIAKDDTLLSEWIEVVATKVDIYDNRLSNCYKSMREDQRDLLNKLCVSVFEEDKLVGCDKKHFLVIHLSFIEKLSDGKRDAEAIIHFWDKCKSFVDNYEFVIITTGRAREWLIDLTDDIRSKVRYIPIENLERCFDEGGNLEPKSPAFGVKYALVKTIFGS